MSDLGGSHSWLLDVGGGVPREGVASDAGRTLMRPSDETLASALGVARVEHVALSDAVERVQARTADGRELRAVLKLSGFWCSDTERRLYRELLRSEVDGSPRLLASAQGWLLLEELVDARPLAFDDSADVRAVYRRLAEIHAAHVDVPGRPAGLRQDLAASPLSAADAEAFARGVERLAELIEHAARDADAWEISGATLHQVDDLRVWARERAPRLAETGPLTLLHGDYQRTNWLIDAESGAGRVLDWELAALGPGLLDFYYLSPAEPGAGHAPAGSMARRAVEWYCERLADLGVVRLSSDAAWACLPDVVVWGAIAGAVMRLEDFYAERRRSRTPRGELLRAVATLLHYARDQLV